jgi:hypothetical protein
MATIDPSIAMGYKPVQIQDPLNRMAAMMQIEGSQNQNALAQYQLASAKRTDEKTNFLNESIAKNTDRTTGKINQLGVYSDLASGGFGSAIPELQAKFTDIEHKGNINKEVVSRTAGLDFKQKVDKQNKALAAIAALDTPQAAIADINKHLADGEIDQSQADKLKADIAREPNFRNWQKSTLLSVLDAKDRLVTEETARANLVREANAAEQLGVSKGQLGVAQGNLGVSKQRLQLEQNKEKRDLTMGTIPAGYRLSADGTSLEPIPGGPTTVPLAPKDKQKREAVYPKATSALKAFDDTSNSLIKDLAELRDHPGLSSITGIAAGRLPGVTKEGREAQALYDKIVARGGFQALTDLKAAGGTLGAVSNQEGTQLKDSWAAINRTQDASSVKKALDQALATVQTSKDRIRDEYDTTYEYRNTVPRSNTVSPAAPNQTKSGATVSNW